MSIFIPVIGYMIIFNEKLQEYFVLSSSFLGVHEYQLLPNKLYFFYFGLTFLGLGTVIYDIFCPKIIRRYEDTISYVDREFSISFLEKSQGKFFPTPRFISNAAHASRGYPKRISINSRTEDGNIALKEAKYDADWLIRIEFYRRTGVVPTKGKHATIEQHVQNPLPPLQKVQAEASMRAIYRMRNRTYLYARIVASVFFMLGFVTIGIPTVHTFVQVLNTFFQFFS